MIVGLRMVLAWMLDEVCLWHVDVVWVWHEVHCWDEPLMPAMATA